MEFSDYVIFVDESGDHSLTGIDRDFPVFALDFCIFEKSHYIETVVPLVSRFKFDHFGHDAVVLHEHEIRRQTPPFAFLTNQARRERFMQELGAIVEAAEFTILASVIQKDALAKRYDNPGNPYEVALLFCMERAHAFLAERGQAGRKTHVIVERRGRREDEQLELAFRRVCDGGNYRGRQMPELDIVLASKQINSPGLQLADLTARPIALRCLRPEQPNRAFDALEPKIRRSPTGRTDGWGLKVFP